MTLGEVAAYRAVVLGLGGRWFVWRATDLLTLLKLMEDRWGDDNGERLRADRELPQ